MSARITVLSGPESGAAHDLTDDVTRLGSGADCEVRLNGVSSHVATLQYRNGAYVLHHRGARPFALNGRPLQPQQSAPWPSGAQLDLDGIILQLEVDSRNPAPVAPDTRPFADEPLVQATTPPTEAQPSSGSSSKSLQWTIIVACVVAIAVIRSAGGRADADRRPTNLRFQQLVEELYWQDDERDRRWIAMREGLRRARVCELRRDFEQAMTFYARVRSIALDRRAADGSFPTKAEQETYDFVKSRLQVMSRQVDEE